MTSRNGRERYRQAAEDALLAREAAESLPSQVTTEA
jgi:hypothetical protein